MTSRCISVKSILFSLVYWGVSGFYLLLICLFILPSVILLNKLKQLLTKACP